MPLPSPKGTQDKASFVSSCMCNSMINDEYPNDKQRAAVCYSQWKRAKGCYWSDARDGLFLKEVAPEFEEWIEKDPFIIW